MTILTVAFQALHATHRVRRIERTRHDLLSPSAGTVQGLPGLGAKGGKIPKIRKYFLMAYRNHVVSLSLICLFYFVLYIKCSSTKPRKRNKCTFLL
jgi:hypothetical protein